MERVHYVPHSGVNQVIVAVPTEDRDVVLSADKPYTTKDGNVQMALDGHPQVKRISDDEAAQLEKSAKAEAKSEKGGK